MRVVVTGAAGRLGLAVLAELCGEHDVVAFDRVRPARGDGARVRLGDHGDLGQIVGAIKGADVVVHLSAITYPGLWAEEVQFASNVVGAFNVAEAAALVAVPKLVFASSPSPLGFVAPRDTFRLAYLPVDEDHPLAPHNAYGLSKLVTEEILRAWQRRTGGAALALRPCYIITPEERDTRVRPRLERPELAAGNLFNYVDVRDAAAAFRLAVERDLPGFSLFFVGAADSLARAPLAELLPRYYPGTEALAAPLTGAQPAISSARAERALGYRARHSWRDLFDA
ncbi:MAG TPA: NAD(P)-dependent oxidoreductase [Candidatus Binatia bacterium]|nr:NAD(P)-dependent oxidoreductase [Candidatus Binatia bacterium]